MTRTPLGASLALVLLAGCASAAPLQTASISDQTLGAWVSAETAARRPLTFARGNVLEPTAAGHITRIAAPTSSQFPARGRPVDISLHRAPLGSALRLLAEAADLGIVLGEGLTAPVDVDLRRVRPVDAMIALAEAHRVELSVRGRTVIARHPD